MVVAWLIPVAFFAGVLAMVLLNLKRPQHKELLQRLHVAEMDLKGWRSGWVAKRLGSMQRELREAHQALETKEVDLQDAEAARLQRDEYKAMVNDVRDVAFRALRQRVAEKAEETMETLLVNRDELLEKLNHIRDIVGRAVKTWTSKYERKPPRDLMLVRVRGEEAEEV